MKTKSGVGGSHYLKTLSKSRKSLDVVPKMTKQKRYAWYTMPDTTNFSNEVKRKLISTALKIALTFVAMNHMDNFDNELKKQQKRGPILVWNRLAS